ncbi:carbohydrate-binding protein, partial [Brumimicrobium oceani]|uniref:hypothetical protein n=1 Tax=Brumimicrobium oceani TaxID=2100725 RepID=UPI0018EEC33E
MKKYLLTTALLIFVVFQGIGQRFDYENTSKVFFGLNIGSVWHTSDVENAKERFPLGAGFVFGGSMNQNYGNAVSFDLRFRYLGGTWYGKDSDTTSAIQNNYAVQPLYDTLGYTVQNFRTAQHRFALELSIHANRFKERTGIDPYIFGGIGITASNINGDLLKKSGIIENGTIYPYNETPNGSIIDEKYETPLDMNAAGESYTPDDFDFKVLPSLGVGIGYYFNSRFSMGLEHKTTFVRDDYFDGTTLNQNAQESDLIKNDLYHYTSIYFKWYLRGSKNRYTHPVDNPPVEPQPHTPGVEPTRGDKPIVDFSNPQNTPHRTNSPVFDLRANVRNVSSAQWITFTQNQNRSTSFVFNPQAQTFQANVQLVPGLNTFFIKGENQYGKARDLVEIYYDEEPRETPPIVKITDPSVSPYVVNQLTYNLTADIRNIKARNQLTVTLNGQNLTNFNFNAAGSNNFSIPLNLNSGTNVLRIEGRNNAGMDSDEVTFVYEREAPANPPVVNIVIPSASPFTTNQQNENLVAKVEFVNNKQNIEVSINGTQTNNFSFDNSTGRVQFNVGLNPGINTIRISANNAYGNDFDETQIIYHRSDGEPKLPPTVDIVTPAASPFATTEPYENITANINYVNTKQQVQVRVNGVLTNNFAFNPLQNSSMHQVQFNAVLSEGNNTIRITANNNYGNDFDETIIIYYKEGIDQGYPPLVDITTPISNPYTTTNASETVIADVEYISEKSEIGVQVNNVQVSNFTYSAVSKQVQFTAHLNPGVNTIRVTASTAYGNAFDETQIVYRKKEEPTPPTVQIVTPNANPFNTVQATQNIVATTSFIALKQQVEVSVNGTTTNSFTFNSGTGNVELTTGLNPGVNTVRISVTNVHGNAFDETQIVYRKKEKPTPPTVQIVTPNANPFNTVQATQNIVATTSFIALKQQVEVSVNGTTTNNFTFNSGTGNVELTTGLNPGVNTVRISVTNVHGNAFDETQIVYRKKEKPTPPTVQIVTPNANPFNTVQATQNIVATTSFIALKQQVEVRVNGTTTNNFTFNSGTGKVELTTGLNPGVNTVRISVTNVHGNAFDETQIVYRK